MRSASRCRYVITELRDCVTAWFWSGKLDLSILIGSLRLGVCVCAYRLDFCAWLAWLLLAAGCCLLLLAACCCSLLAASRRCRRRASCSILISFLAASSPTRCGQHESTGMTERIRSRRRRRRRRRRSSSSICVRDARRELAVYYAGMAYSPGLV